ncbi:hypothetical protein BDQ17DRAFT_885733 [Cyathus striatus]|nr:hypothetical protein BDQ17DRAFT_885733 [Cyathus striatus]
MIMLVSTSLSLALLALPPFLSFPSPSSSSIYSLHSPSAPFLRPREEGDSWVFLTCVSRFFLLPYIPPPFIVTCIASSSFFHLIFLFHLSLSSLTQPIFVRPDIIAYVGDQVDKLYAR